jgi:predicted cobalt transporter CbtA
VEVTVNAISDPARPLQPGATGNLTVTVTNQHGAAVHLTSIVPGPGPVIADDAHREAGCVRPRVEFTRTEFPVSWEVPRNTVGAFILNGVLTMRAGGPAACQGATFTVPVRAQATQP